MADTKISALTALTGANLAGGDLAAVVDISDTTMAASGTDKKMTMDEVVLGLQRIGALPRVKAVSSQINVSSTTPAKATALDLTLEAGTFNFQYNIAYQAAAATTGIKFDVNFSGTVTRFVWWQRWVDVSATAATAVPDQDAVLATGSVMGAFASRAKGTAGRGVTLSVDTLNADMMMIIEGIAVVSVAGDLQLYHGSEVAAQSSLMPGTNLVVVRAA